MRVQNWVKKGQNLVIIVLSLKKFLNHGHINYAKSIITADKNKSLCLCDYSTKKKYLGYIVNICQNLFGNIFVAQILSSLEYIEVSNINFWIYKNI